MSYTQRFTEDSGQTLYAVPSTITPSTWDSLKVACTEPFTGLYSVTVDETLGSEWWIYIGATVPSDWDDRIGAIGTNPELALLTTLASTGRVTVVNPVDSTGKINGAIVIGDYYLAANSRAFSWTIPAISGVTAATAVPWFGGKLDTDNSWLVSGTLTVDGSNWVLSFDLAKTITASLAIGYYAWSVEVKSVSGVEITRVRSDTNQVQLVEKQT